MDELDGAVGHGTLLAGRYRLQHPMPSDLPVDAWQAVDQILDRPVRAQVLRGPRVASALDAARRAALVNDPRLVRVLDVGEHDGTPYVVTEPHVGQSLDQLTETQPLAADQARALIGEAAAALEVARRRGVHHLALRPSCVRRTSDAGVVVTGLAIDGALLGHPDDDARTTSRTDAVGLVRLLYHALTGRWPGEAIDGVPPAPVIGGVPVPPADLVPGVPNDLDTLCAVTLGPNQDGPHSPAELVRELEPWPAIAVDDLFVGTSAGPAEPDDVAPKTPRTPPRKSVRTAFTGSVPPPGTPLAAPPWEPTSSVAALSTAGMTASGPSVASVPLATIPLPDATPPAGIPHLGLHPREETAQRRETAAAPRPAAPVRRSVVPPRTSRPEQLLPTAPAQRPAFDELVGASALTRRRFDPTRVVLAVVALAVVVGLIWSVKNLTAPVGPIFRGSDDPVVVAPGGEASPSPEEEEEESPEPEVEPVIASGEQIDPPPDGDQNEHPEAVHLAYDGDPSTFWYSRTYVSPTYGMKSGIGYGITLAEPATVRSVTLHVNGSGGNVELRATDPSTPTEGDVLASGPLSPETVLELSEPTETEHLVLWFTELPQAPDGGNRIELTEIEVH